MKCPALAKERKLALRGSKCGGELGHHPQPAGFTLRFVDVMAYCPEPDGKAVILCGRCHRWTRWSIEIDTSGTEVERVA